MKPTVPQIIGRITKKGEQFAHMTYVGPSYTKADLLADLRALPELELTDRATLLNLLDEVTHLAKMVCKESGSEFHAPERALVMRIDELLIQNGFKPVLMP